jgi:hypothetical protein
MLEIIRDPASFGRPAFSAPNRSSAAVITDTLSASAYFSNLSANVAGRRLMM